MLGCRAVELLRTYPINVSLPSPGSPSWVFCPHDSRLGESSDRFLGMVVSAFGGCLEHIEDEVVPRMVAAWARVLVVPVPVVNWDLHFRRVTVVQAIAALVVLAPQEVLGIKHVRVMVEPLYVPIAACTSPCAAVGSRIGCLSGQTAHAY